MARKITMRQRILEFAMTENRPQLDDALEILKAALATRFPQTRKPRNKSEKVDKPLVIGSGTTGITE